MTRHEPNAPPVATSSQTVGPFFHVGPAGTDRFGRMAASDTPGDHIRLDVRVLDGDGAPVPDAMVELWQANDAGEYPPPAVAPEAKRPSFTGFGRLGTDDDGWCRFETIRPGAVVSRGIRQARHINVCVFARGMLRHLYTRIYFDGDPALAHDPLLSAVPASRRPTLLARAPAPGAAWEFVLRLQGRDETVFFDV
jgi:protocatechuate 3,4-dioxygenase alpha subunit